MRSLDGVKVLVTGGSRGLGLGMVEALVAKGAHVTIVARNPETLRQVERRLGVATVSGDVADVHLARRVLGDVKPTVLILNAGAKPPGGLIHEQTWEGFTQTWESDVKAAFHWVQQALSLPLPSGSRVLLGSSGAAVNGSPLSGGYAGAKRMIWLLAKYANASAQALKLGISFQAIVPQQMVGDTDLGRTAAELYAQRQGVTPEQFLAGYGAALSSARVGEHVAAILTDPQYEQGVAFGLKGDTGITVLEA